MVANFCILHYILFLFSKYIFETIKNTSYCYNQKNLITNWRNRVNHAPFILCAAWNSHQYFILLTSLCNETTQQYFVVDSCSRSSMNLESPVTTDFLDLSFLGAFHSYIPHAISRYLEKIQKQTCSLYTHPEPFCGSALEPRPESWL